MNLTRQDPKLMLMRRHGFFFVLLYCDESVEFRLSLCIRFGTSIPPFILNYAAPLKLTFYTGFAFAGHFGKQGRGPGRAKCHPLHVPSRPPDGEGKPLPVGERQQLVGHAGGTILKLFPTLTFCLIPQLQRCCHSKVLPGGRPPGEGYPGDHGDGTSTVIKTFIVFKL